MDQQVHHPAKYRSKLFRQQKCMFLAHLVGLLSTHLHKHDMLIPKRYERYQLPRKRLVKVTILSSAQLITEPEVDNHSSHLQESLDEHLGYLET